MNSAPRRKGLRSRYHARALTFLLAAKGVRLSTPSEGPSRNMPGQDDIQRRIQARIGQGEFLAGLLHVASRQSGAVQEQFVAQLSRIAGAMRELMGASDLIRRLPYRPGAFWPGLR